MVRLTVVCFGLFYFGLTHAFFWNWILTNPHSLSSSQSDSVVQLSNNEPVFDQKSSPAPTTSISTTIENKSEDRFIGHPKHLRDISTPAMDFPTTTVPNRLEINQVNCKSGRECAKDQFCDLHYQQCRALRKADEQCRSDYHCIAGFDCMYGRCLPHVKSGHEGARCTDAAECSPNFCCVRQHGERVCKRKLAIGQLCYVPDGGLAYFLNEMCPCEDGLVCGEVRTRNTGRVLPWLSELAQAKQHRCVQP